MGNTLTYLTKTFDTTDDAAKLPQLPSNAELKEAEAVAAPQEVPVTAVSGDVVGTETNAVAHPISKRKMKRLAREEKQRARKRIRREEQRSARADLKRTRRAERLASLA
eukprot:IDg7259t1